VIVHASFEPRVGASSWLSHKLEYLVRECRLIRLPWIGKLMLCAEH
jgi:hypothetical protein